MDLLAEEGKFCSPPIDFLPYCIIGTMWQDSQVSTGDGDRERDEENCSNGPGSGFLLPLHLFGVDS